MTVSEPPPAAPPPGHRATWPAVRVGHRVAWWVLVGAVGVTVAVLALWVLPAVLVPAGDLSAADRVGAQNGVRAAAVALLAIVGTAAAAWNTLRTYQQSLEGNRLARLGEERGREANALVRKGQDTDLYAGAVAGLGHEQAAVRLGSLYALERLAEDNPERRATVVAVLCAYLRMPFAEDVFPGNDEPDRAVSVEEVRAADGAELLVRLAAQQILTDHARVPGSSYWADLRLDLSGAVLVNADFALAAVEDLRCTGTQFVGKTWFASTRIANNARFEHARFHDDAEFLGTQASWCRFDQAHFHKDVIFHETPVSRAFFEGTVFHGLAKFNNLDIASASFEAAVFHGHAGFEGATSKDLKDAPVVSFEGAAFHGEVTFERTVMRHVAFLGAHFFCGVRFDGAVFGTVALSNATISGGFLYDRGRAYRISFMDASVEGGLSLAAEHNTTRDLFAGCRVPYLPDRPTRTEGSPPQGWAVVPAENQDPALPGWGRLVYDPEGSAAG